MFRKISICLSGIVVSLLLVLPSNLVYGGEQPSGKPFDYLNSLVDVLENQTGSLEDRLTQAEEALEALKVRVTQNEGDIGDLYESIADLEAEIAAIKDQLQYNGKKVAPGLYEVHKRLLWDIGWMEPAFGDSNGKFTYNEYPKSLVYGYNRTSFLAPLSTGSYGIPAVQAGATRKVRLYVTYGHQWMCGGTVTVRIGDVDFSLPHISGHYAAMGANWSDLKTEEEYEHLGHTGIQVFMKDFFYDGTHCGPWPGTDRPKGVMYRIEAYFYDEFPE